MFKRLAFVIAAALLLSGVVYVDRMAYRRGYAAASVAYEEAAQAEIARVAEANRRAWEQAMRDIDALTAQKEERDEFIEELQAEAAADSDAGRTALSPSSVQRIDSIR